MVNPRKAIAVHNANFPRVTHAKDALAPRILLEEFPGVVINPAEPAHYWVSLEVPLRLIDQKGKVHLFHYKCTAEPDFALVHHEFDTLADVRITTAAKASSLRERLRKMLTDGSVFDDAEYSKEHEISTLVTLEKFTHQDCFRFYTREPVRKVNIPCLNLLQFVVAAPPTPEERLKRWQRVAARRAHPRNGLELQLSTVTGLSPDEEREIKRENHLIRAHADELRFKSQAASWEFGLSGQPAPRAVVEHYTDDLVSDDLYEFYKEFFAIMEDGELPSSDGEISSSSSSSDSNSAETDSRGSTPLLDERSSSPDTSEVPATRSEPEGEVESLLRESAPVIEDISSDEGPSVPPLRVGEPTESERREFLANYRIPRNTNPTAVVTPNAVLANNVQVQTVVRTQINDQRARSRPRRTRSEAPTNRADSKRARHNSTSAEPRRIVRFHDERSGNARPRDLRERLALLPPDRQQRQPPAARRRGASPPLAYRSPNVNPQVATTAKKMPRKRNRNKKTKGGLQRHADEIPPPPYRAGREEPPASVNERPYVRSDRPVNQASNQAAPAKKKRRGGKNKRSRAQRAAEMSEDGIDLSWENLTSYRPEICVPFLNRDVSKRQVELSIQHIAKGRLRGSQPMLHEHESNTKLLVGLADNAHQIMSCRCIPIQVVRDFVGVNKNYAPREVIGRALDKLEREAPVSAAYIDEAKALAQAFTLNKPMAAEYVNQAPLRSQYNRDYA